MPIEEKLTVTGLPTTDETCIGKVLSLITAAPLVGEMADRCTTPPAACTVTSTGRLRFIAAIRARTSWVAISDVACRSRDCACHRRNSGIAKLAAIDRMATAIISSISVKPLLRFKIGWITETFSLGQT